MHWEGEAHAEPLKRGEQTYCLLITSREREASGCVERRLALVR